MLHGTILMWSWWWWTRGTLTGTGSSGLWLYDVHSWGQLCCWLCCQIMMHDALIFYNKCVRPCLVPACTARIIIFLLSVSKFWFLGNKVGNICLWRLCCDNLGGALPWWLGWQDANRWKFAFEWASVREQGQCRCRASILANQTWDNWWALIGGVLECYPTHVWLINDTHQTIT